MPPWEKYQQTIIKKPWEKYATQPASEPIPTEAKESFGRGLYRETISPLLSGISTFALGLPKTTAEVTGAKEIMYPEQKTFGGKILRGGAEMAGFLLGAPLKAGQLAVRGATKLIPPLAGKGLFKTATKLGIEGMGAGLALTPEKTFLGSKERLEQAKIFGTIGAVVPFAGKALKGTGQIITKSGRWVAKNIGGITDATVDTIKRLGAERVFEPLKANADYITQNLTPKIENMFKQSVSKFTPEIQKFAQEKLKIPISAINTIKSKGTKMVQDVRQSLGDTTDTIYQKIAQGFEDKRMAANQAYRIAVDNVPKNFGGTIDVRNTVKTMNNVFKGSLGEATRGQQGNRLYLIMKELESRIPLPKGFGAQPLTPTQIRRQYRGEKLTDIADEVRLNKKQFMELRDALNNLYRENPYDRNIAKVMNQLYVDGESSGLTGLQKARSLQKQAFDAEENLSKSLIKEKKLDNFHKLSQDQIRQLREIENYTGIKFVDDLDILTASRYLDKFGKIDQKKIATDLIQARNLNWTKYVKSKYDEILGEKNFKDIYDDLMAHFANIDFELVSETPGAGGGFYPSRAGLLRSGVARGIKGYYKGIQPKLEGLRKLSEKVISPIFRKVNP